MSLAVESSNKEETGMQRAEIQGTEMLGTENNRSMCTDAHAGRTYRTRRTLPRRFAVLAATLAAAVTLAGPAQAQKGVWDPVEGLNRGIFGFNEIVDKWLVGPIARGWDFVLPDRVENCIGNAYTNAAWPVNLTNHFLQGKFNGGAHATGRFVVNTTAGVGGLFDVAAGLGWEPNVEDTGQTLGAWGIGAGPYLVLPFTGPSNLRDLAGTSVDQGLRIWPGYANLETYWMVEAPRIINMRSSLENQIQTGRETSLDYYSFVRNAYDQNRNAAIADTTDTSEENEDDLYFMDY